MIYAYLQIVSLEPTKKNSVQCFKKRCTEKLCSVLFSIIKGSEEPQF